MKILIVQTAFIGDVVLSTPLVEKLKVFFPQASIHFLLRKGNEELFLDHPKIDQVWVWDKKHHKIRNLLHLIVDTRKVQYDLVINLHRFWSTGLLTVLAGADRTVGFRSNPMSWWFDRSIRYDLTDRQHEVMRNLALIADITDKELVKPKLYPRKSDKVKSYMSALYMTISPGSIWFTKRLPLQKWVEFLDEVAFRGDVFILGGRSDYELAEEIRNQTQRALVKNLCGELSMLESASLMQSAVMNYVNDSAPLHFASAVNAPVCALFCSTVPEFGFGPLSSVGHVIELKTALPCRPCGAHGYEKCPQKHFKCGNDIVTTHLIEMLA